MKKNKEVGFSLVKIETVQFATIEMEVEDQSKIDIQANIDFGVNSENKRVLCQTKFEYQNESAPFIIVEVNCEFQFNNATWSSFCNNSEIELPIGVLQHLAVLTIGTVRGVLHTKTENTEYNKFFLPTLNISGMLKENLKFSLGT